MKLTIQRADLARILTNVGRVVEAKNTIPILGNVLLSASDNQLTVTGTDLDIEAIDCAPADIDQPGSVCVDAKLLADISKKAGADSISMSLDGDRLAVASGRSKFKLETLSPADFPHMAGSDYTAEFDLDIAGLFAPVAFAIGNDSNRPFLSGIFFHNKDGKAVAVATNGHRLARHVGGEVAEFVGIIVPQKTVSLLPKGVVRASVNENLIRIEAGDFIITSKLIDGTYPNYAAVIPMHNALVASADKGDILKAADRVATVSNEKGNAVKLSIAAGAIALTVRSQTNEAADEVQAEYSGQPVEIGFNSLYLRDALQVFPDGLVDIAVNDNLSPARLTSPAYSGLDVTLMPMRV